jgi:hypothetical protein
LNPCSEITLDEPLSYEKKAITLVSVRPDFPRVSNLVDNSSRGVEPYFSQPYIRRRS